MLLHDNELIDEIVAIPGLMRHLFHLRNNDDVGIIPSKGSSGGHGCCKNCRRNPLADRDGSNFWYRSLECCIGCTPSEDLDRMFGDYYYY